MVRACTAQDMPGISGSPFSDALVNLNQYTAHLLYKCASDPSSGTAAQVLPPPPCPCCSYGDNCTVAS